MPFEIIRNDITVMAVDAVVNATDPFLSGGGGIDAMIHRAAGPKLAEKCRRLGGCNTGEAKLTRGYDLPAKYIIHTVGPVWQGGGNNEESNLALCYRNCLALARKKRLKSAAFPLISAGEFSYPCDKAMRIALSEISTFLLENEMKIYLVLFDRQASDIGGRLFSDIKEYIDDKYAKEHYDRSRRYSIPPSSCSAPCAGAPLLNEDLPSAMPTVCRNMQTEKSLKELTDNLDESFSQMLLRKIDEKGITDVECYKRANIDRKLFSKIRSNKHYKPKKVTAIAFAIALELDLDETKSLLEKAGYALSHSSKFDIIIEYFIANSNYNIFEINEALFAFDQVLLGA